MADRSRRNRMAKRMMMPLAGLALAGLPLAGLPLAGLALAIAAVAPAHATTASDDACVTAEEHQALSLRVLQTNLMVGALTCGHHQTYNQFIRRFSSTLSDRGQDMRAFFSRQYGRKGDERLNQFVTALANQASRDATRQSTQDFCRGANRSLEEVLKLTPESLDGYITRTAAGQAHGYPLCPPPVLMDAGPVPLPEMEIPTASDTGDS